MIELHVLRLSEDGDKILLAAHPEAETAGYAIAVDARIRDIVLPPADSTSVVDDSDMAPEEVPEPEPEPEPVYELPARPLAVSDPAEALETAHGLRLMRVAPPSANGDGTGEGDTGDDTVEGEAAVDGDGGRQAATVPLDSVSDLGLHDSVLANLHKWNVRIPTAVLDEGWWVTKLGDKAWQISFRFLSRGRIHEAEWVLDTDEAMLVPENDLAAMLGWWKQARPRRPRRRRGGRGRRRSPARKRGVGA
ncbi:MAG: hypothetical protein IT198_02315 [Acidimicrobiia bacterium]|nr:hypothetical protein [Acidimicrobiia bacterium]